MRREPETNNTTSSNWRGSKLDSTSRRWKKGEYVGSVLNVVREVCRIRSTGEPLGETVNLTDAAALQSFVVYHERLPAGTGTSHFLYNDGAEDAEYIMVASRQERDTITYTRDLPSNSLPNKRAS